MSRGICVSCANCSPSSRHGARLDAADENWHLTSPTPYDPPLSYGGWLQSRALGARIISLLSAQDDSAQSPRSDRSSVNTSPDTSTRSSPQPTPRKKRRIIIHTSPYLRCLQTAIAVSSGISQYQPSPECDTVGASTGLDDNANATTSSPESHRSLLRVDAFLGEWLCPDYFDEIAPPPQSERLVGAAKAELLRQNVNTVPEADMSNRPQTGYFPGGWGSYSTPGSPDPEEKEKLGPLPGNNAIKGQRYRAGSYDSLNTANNQRPKGLLSKINTNLSSIPNDSPGSYVPPTPSYAIASSDPIPAGYVAHARNACVKIDYQWDSMRQPQNWGHGGDYGEEWSAMHDRFFNGLESMVEWYQDYMLVPHPSSNEDSQKPLDANEGSDDDEVDTVLVLITHGAGCNAMVGALTGGPVLLDFNTTSLTMAVRKDDFQDGLEVDGAHEPTKCRRRSASDPCRLHDYDLTMAASVDHLRPRVVPSQGGSSTLPSPTSSPSPTIAAYRPRTTSRPSLSQGQFTIGPSARPSLSSNTWTNGRPSTAPRGGTGLWGSSSANGDAGSDSADEIVPNFGGPASSSKSVNGADGPEPKRDDRWESSLPQRTLSQRGLWGSAPLNMDREAGVKRRWTVSERRV